MERITAARVLYFANGKWPVSIAKGVTCIDPLRGLDQHANELPTLTFFLVHRTQNVPPCQVKRPSMNTPTDVG